MMTKTPEIHVGDVGTQIEATIVDDDCVVLDISDATVKEIKIKPPQGVTQTHTAEFLSDGSDGIIYFITEVDDISIAGMWKIQGRVTTLDGVWNTKIGTFEVKTNL